MNDNIADQDEVYQRKIVIAASHEIVHLFTQCVLGFVDGAHLNDIQHRHGELLLNAGAEFGLKGFAEQLLTQSCGNPRKPHNNQANER